jgi:DNA-binding MarR family transcriptional regulator
MSDGRATGMKMAHECLALRMRAINRALTQVYDEQLRQLGSPLKASQLSLLATIATAGPLRAQDLVDVLSIDKTTLSRNLTRLEKHGWISRSPGRDGRELDLVATDEGRAVLDAAEPAWTAAQAEMSRRLGDDGVSALWTLAERML